MRITINNKIIVAVVAATHDDFLCWQAMYGKNDEHYILISRPFYDGMVFDRIEFDETAHKVPKQFYINLKTTKDEKSNYKPFSGRVLNLYAGLGGNRKKWQGVDVTAVEMEEDIANVYKQNFPNDTVIIGDAHQYLLDHAHEFDFIWTSPPCQTHSRMMKATRHKKKRYSDMSLYQEIIFLQHFYKGKWVVENVKPYYEPLIKPTAVIGRHYFWANFEIKNVIEPKQPKGFITKGTAAETQELKEWLGIHYEGNIYYKDNHCPGQVLRNCVHPDLGLAVFENGL